MKIQQEFTVFRPIDVVWAYFHDIPRVAAALPGAEYTGEKDGKHTGKVTSKVGPFQASFEGEAAVVYNDADKSVQMEGKGVDKKGASRGKMVMSCALASVDAESTKVIVDSDVQLSGTIAQFGRTGLLTEIANVLVKDFVANAEADMAPQSAAPAAAADISAAPGSNSYAPSTAAPSAAPVQRRASSKPISGSTLLMLSLKAWIRGWFKKSA